MLEILKRILKNDLMRVKFEQMDEETFAIRRELLDEILDEIEDEYD